MFTYSTGINIRNEYDLSEFSNPDPVWVCGIPIFFCLNRSTNVLMFDKIVVTEERKRIDHNQCQFKFLYLRGGISMDSVFKWMVSVQSP